MTYQYPMPLEHMGSWIADNVVSKNIQAVVHTGDIVENGFEPLHWTRFDLCYLQFCDQVLYFPVAGNHDIAVNRNSYEAYLERPFFAAYPPENLYENGKALYTTIEESSIKLLLIGAGWEVEEEAAEWIDEVIAAHPDHTVILLFHSYIKSNGGFTAIGKRIFDRLVVPNQNVRLVLSGHVSERKYSGARVDEIDDDGDGVPDRSVWGLMYNYQQVVDKKSGQLRLLTFDPVDHSLTVRTYSPYTGYNYRDHAFGSSVFVIDNAF